MVYVDEYGFGERAQTSAGSIKRAVNNIQGRLEEMIERLNERDVVDARPAIEAWMLQAADKTEDTPVRVMALTAVHSAMATISNAVFYNREDGQSRYLSSYFGKSLSNRADALVECLPYADGLLNDILEVSRETNDADVRAATYRTYIAVRSSMKSMTGYEDEPVRAAAIQSMAPDAAVSQRPARHV